MILFLGVGAYAQEEQWEPQKNITGYIATEGDYFFNIEGYDRNYGVSLSEAGLLVSYKPLNKLLIKSVVVYRPGFSINQILNEASGEWQFSQSFNLKLGRFLTPLSTMNTYYYAPVNSSVTLPMVISNHMSFPLNVEALSVNGKFGENFKLDYDLFIGGFKNSLSLTTGPLDFFGAEETYFKTNGDSTSTSGMQNNFREVSNPENENLNFCKGAHVGIGYQEYAQLGLNVFSGNEIMEVMGDAGNGGPQNPQPQLTSTNMDRTSFGISLRFKYENLTLSSEYWMTEYRGKDSTTTLEYDSKGAFCELNYSMNKLTPYARFEYENTSNSIAFNRYSFGINYKPVFETTLKLEYMHYTDGSINLDGIVGSVIYSF